MSRRRVLGGTLAVVEASHDFSAVFARRAFVGGRHLQDACTWAVEEAERLRLEHASKDPQNADIIHFEPRHYHITVEVDL
jgi:hypothetical protein